MQQDLIALYRFRVHERLQKGHEGFLDYDRLCEYETTASIMKTHTDRSQEKQLFMSLLQVIRCPQTVTIVLFQST